MNIETVESIEAFQSAIEQDYAAWDTLQFPWFRGEPEGNGIIPLLPTVFRPKLDGSFHDENRLLQFFRQRAPVLGLPIVPALERTDEWLFVARHVGLPTRLLDWSEGALIALYFALREEHDSVVWMLNPLGLNKKSVPGGNLVPNEPTLTWFPGSGGILNIYNMNIRAAWELGKGGTELPVAIHPTNIHPRISVQHSCFTVHGIRKVSLSHMVGPDCLRCYRIRIKDKSKALHQLRRLGISESTLFPDADGLSKELELFF